MKSTAERIETRYGVEIPHVDAIVYTDDVRGWCSAKMREIADRLASHELRGARVEWDDNPLQPAFVMVEVYDQPITIGALPKQWAVRLSRVTFKPSAERFAVKTS